MSLAALLMAVASSAPTPGGGGPTGNITVVGSTAPAYNSGDLTIAHPAGHLSGDLAILAFSNRGNDTTPAIAGWTEAVSYTDSGTSSRRRVTILYKVLASSSEADVTLTDTGQGQLGGMLVVRDQDGSTPVTVIDSGSAGATTAVSIGGGSVSANALIIDVFALAVDSDTGQISAGFTNADLSDLTNLWEVNSSQLDGYGIYLAHGVSAGGTIGATEVTLAGAANWCGVKIAINPA